MVTSFLFWGRYRCPSRLLTIYITKACIVSTLVVLRKFALLRATSVPIFKFSIKLALVKPKSRLITDSSMATAALNHAANTKAWTDARGS